MSETSLREHLIIGGPHQSRNLTCRVVLSQSVERVDKQLILQYATECQIA